MSNVDPALSDDGAQLVDDEEDELDLRNVDAMRPTVERQLLDEREYMRDPEFSSDGGEGYVLLMCQRYVLPLLMARGFELLNEGRRGVALDQQLRLFAQKELARLDQIHWSPARVEFGERCFTTKEFQRRFELMILRTLERKILPEWHRQSAEATAANASERPDMLQNVRRHGSDPARWQAIEITFIGDHHVMIRDGRRPPVKRGYAEVGFKDRRSGLPNSAWGTLHLLAQSGGVIRDANRSKGRWTTVEKNMQMVRKTLRNYFLIIADPLPYIAGTGYQARLKISCASTCKH